MMKSLSRRHLLTGAGVALGLPLLEAMLPRGVRSASADTTKPPRRVVFLYTPDGIQVDRWKVPVTAASTKLTPSLVSSSTLSEFARPENNVLDRCLFIEGVPMSSAMDPRNPAQGHPGGTTAMFTGGWAGPGSDYSGGNGKGAGPCEYESIDQVLARLAGGTTRFPAMYAGVHVLDNSVARRMFFAKGQTSITPEVDPAKILNTMFSSVDPKAAAAAKAQTEESAYLLDAVQSDYKRLRCQVGSADRQRLDQHLTQVQDLLKRVQLVGTGPACALPNVDPGLEPDDFAQTPALTGAMMDLIAMAFACDLTRVVGFELQAGDGDDSAVYSWLGQTSGYHTLSHLVGNNAADQLEQADRWRAQQIMGLVKRLQSMKEVDGSTVFDNTTILWASEIGRGWVHDYDDVVFTIVGGGGYFDTGRYLKYSGTNNTRHNLLLSHYLAYFGLNPSSGVGHPDYAGGTPLSGLAKA